MRTVLRFILAIAILVMTSAAAQANVAEMTRIKNGNQIYEDLVGDDGTSGNDLTFSVDYNFQSANPASTRNHTRVKVRCSSDGTNNIGGYASDASYPGLALICDFDSNSAVGSPVTLELELHDGTSSTKLDSYDLIYSAVWRRLTMIYDDSSETASVQIDGHTVIGPVAVDTSVYDMNGRYFYLEAGRKDDGATGNGTVYDNIDVTGGISEDFESYGEGESLSAGGDASWVVRNRIDSDNFWEINTSLDSDWAEPADTTAPAAPAGLTATASDGEVALDWDDNTGDFASYNVYRSTTSGAGFSRVASGLTSSEYLDTVFSGTTYYYIVTAVDAALNESDNSDEVNATPVKIVVTTPRVMEDLNRGLVAVTVTGGVYVGWRMFGTDDPGIGFNLYRDGTLVNSSVIEDSTNYLDENGASSSTYYIRPVLNSVEKDASETVSVWSTFYKDITLNVPAGVTTPDEVTCSYTPNDCSVGDLDGDGELEIVLKWDPSNSHDNSEDGYTGNVYLDAYEMDSTRLWRIDLGVNIRAGAHYTQFVVYDLDSDGKAEVACRTAPGTMDGAGNYVLMDGDDKTSDYRNSDGYILDGPEYLTIFNGETGAEMITAAYVPERGSVSDWGDNYGNRADRFLGCVAYLDGVRPSLVMCRGYYTRSVLAAWNWRDGELTNIWTFDTDEGWDDYYGQGNHNLSVGDVDGDGKDEIIYGQMAVDDDGDGIYSTELGHGDAIHFGDLDPNREGLEVFVCHEENNNGETMRDAATGEIIFQNTLDDDNGRACTGDVDPNYAGEEAWSYADGNLKSCTGVVISSSKPSSCNFAIWWDGDLSRELLNGDVIDKWDPDSSSTGRVLTLYNYDVTYNNSTKKNPCLQADIFGDWREEVISPAGDGTFLRIFTTTDVTAHRIHTLLHDPIYRMGVCWQNTEYNQPPHTSFFLGNDMTLPVDEPNIVLSLDQTPVTLSGFVVE